MNIPEIKLGIIAVSRDCFPIELSNQRRPPMVRDCTNVLLPLRMRRMLLQLWQM